MERLSRPDHERLTTYELVTQRIISKLEQGVVPWRQPWSRQHSEPTSLATGKPYRGINWLMLTASGFGSPYWLTFNEARSRGGYVRPGEKSTPIVYWKVEEREDKDTGAVKRRFLLRHYSIFNLAQVEGIAPPAQQEQRDWNPIEAAENLWRDWEDRPGRHHRGDRAFYSPRTDAITMPYPERFESADEYYATLYHEGIHATGHSSRLNRGLDSDLPPFGSPAYSREELIAELGGAFLCADTGIDNATIDNQAAYLGGWIATLQGDSRLVIAAASQAQRAADYIRGMAAIAEVEPAQGGE